MKLLSIGRSACGSLMEAHTSIRDCRAQGKREDRNLQQSYVQTLELDAMPISGLPQGHQAMIELGKLSDVGPQLSSVLGVVN